MIRLKKSEPFRYEGVYYDFSMLDEAKLQKVYESNPLLRHFFEGVPTEEYIVPSTTAFEEELAKAGILTSNITAKRLAEIKKRKEDDKTKEE